MNYIIEVNTPNKNNQVMDYLHHIIITDANPDPDDMAMIDVEIDALPTVGSHVTIRRGDDVWGHPCPNTQILFWGRHDFSADIQTIFEATI